MVLCTACLGQAVPDSRAEAEPVKRVARCLQWQPFVQLPEPKETEV